jgi:two-component system OmpR family response regulator
MRGNGASVAACIGETRLHGSFSTTHDFVTKCVRHGPCHISQQNFLNVTEVGAYTGQMKPTPHILVVDDHRDIRELVAQALLKDGFRVSTAADGRAMRQIMSNARIDLILLDLMLPGEDGLSICRSLRTNSSIPIIMLTAKGEEIDRVVGLEVGADDYLPKPFGSRELIARIKAVLRRTELSADATCLTAAQRYQFDRWILDAGTRSLIQENGVTLPLSTGEYELLLAFVQRPQRVLSRDQLLDLARGRAATAIDRSIDTQVSRLRKKLEIDPGDPKIIKTVWGGGYVFTPPVAAQ